jgi:hypothetical protein
MDEVIGKFIQQALSVIPSTFAKRLMSIQKLRDSAAGAIGQSVRKQLETDKTIVQVVQDGILKVLSQEENPEVDSVEIRKKL